MAWCLTKQAEQDLLDALKKDGDPQKMWDRGTEGRLEWFTARVGVENAHKLNALYERKMLLKNQIDGLKAFAKSLGGSKAVKNSMLDKIDRVTEVLDKKGIKQFMGDLVDQSLNLHVTEEEFKTLSDFNTKIKELGGKVNKEFKFPTETDRLNYGFTKVQFENYVNDLKLRSRSVSFRDQPIKKITNIVTETPGVFKSLLASLDDSFWGRQGIKTLTNPRTTDIWVKNLIKHFPDIPKQLFAKTNNKMNVFKSGDDVVMSAIKADIYSRPNALNGKYEAGNFGLSVLNEEAYPSSLPEKIPLLGRLFKTSEALYNGAALRLRADLADRFITMAEKNGVNMLSKDEAKHVGYMISSLTGRGNLGKAEVLAKEINNFAFSIKFLKSNVDTLTAPLKYASKKSRGEFSNKGEEFANKQSAINTLGIISTLGAILTIAKILNPNSVEEDPRSSKFGKIKMFGNYHDISGGLAGLITLTSRLVPTYHNGELGFWTKGTNGDYRNLTKGVSYGGTTALDVFESFLEGKLSPVAGLVRDIWTGKDYQGNELTPLTIIERSTVPLGLQSSETILKNPNSTFILGSLLLEALGVSSSSSIIPNSNSKAIPEGKPTSNRDLINYVTTYAEALGTDPETAFNRIFTGQEIKKVTNGTIIVERMPLKDSTNIKKKFNANNPTMKLDHTIPLELGGSNDESNLKLVTTSEWSSYTKIENALGKALKEKKITKQEAQKLIVDFKNKKVTKEYILSKYK